MQFTKIALAAAVTLVAAQAQAATVYMTGASATAANYRSALQALCTANTGTPTTVLATSAAGTDYKNMFYVKCTTDFKNIPGVNAVSFNVAGGSFSALSVAFGVESRDFLDVTATGANAGVTVVTGQTSSGGFMDIDAAAFPAAVTSALGADVPATAAASFSQVFGVAVSPDLYTALQSKAGLTGCGVDSMTIACQPSITKAQYATIVNDVGNSAKEKGAEFLLGSAYAGQKLTVCRRVSSSGTQASSNQFFLNYYIGGDGAVGGFATPADANFDGYTNASNVNTFDLKEGSGTGDARTCLSNAGYAIGVLSMENFPKTIAAATGSDADKKFRFVKINGVAGYDGSEASGEKLGIASAKDGSYEFWFTSQKYGHNTNGTNVVNAIDAELSTLSGLKGLFSNSSSAAKRDSNVSPIRFD